MPERRCSASCQGCHVNPNGGGMRSEYGKWNESRWLRSFAWQKNTKQPKPFPEQGYGRHSFTSKSHIWPLEESHQDQDEALFDRRHQQAEIIAASPQEFEFQIPTPDPYRQTDKIHTGADVRWQVGKRNTKNFNFLMAADIGVRYRPYKGLDLVFETRFTGRPKQTWHQTMLRSETRSLYLLANRLPYGSYIMGGLYRPMFANYDPNHYSLAQSILASALRNTRQAYDLNFQALSIGSAPNVPYMNLHLIGPRRQDPLDKTQGYALNTGLRFVTMGTSLTYSYWNTNNPGTYQKLQMHAWGTGMHWRRITTLYEGIYIAKDLAHKTETALVNTISSHIRLWRQFYSQFSLAQANTSPILSPGNTRQYSLGLRAFIVSGLDLNLALERNLLSEQTEDLITAQIHLYF